MNNNNIVTSKFHIDSQTAANKSKKEAETRIKAAHAQWTQENPNVELVVHRFAKFAKSDPKTVRRVLGIA